MHHDGGGGDKATVVVENGAGGRGDKATAMEGGVGGGYKATSTSS